MAVHHRCLRVNRQSGLVVLVIMLILVLAGASLIFSLSEGSREKIEQEKRTHNALAEAKAALIGYAASINLVHSGCGASCRRPGDLPCPDTNNDGVAETSCGNASGTTGQSNRLGRLPWRTLGLDDIKDGSGERLWYAVSNRFKQNTRSMPLNSDTNGTISVIGASGSVLHDGTSSTGAVAVVISASGPLLRQDGLQQLRSLDNENSAAHYLDQVYGEDNADFVDASSNGFVTGPVLDNRGHVILNDRVVPITKTDIMNVIEPRVASEVKRAIESYFSVNAIYPSPAHFSDVTCLGVATIITGACMQNSMIYEGRIPANPTPAWNTTSILAGVSNNNWFQQNGWRELVYYASGALTLQNTSGIATSKNVLILATGSALGAQSRASSLNKTSESNYLELENLSLLDNVYMRVSPRNQLINDYIVSVP